MTPLPVTPLPAAAPMRRSIAGRLLFWFLVIALIPCAVLTAITARIAASSLERSVRDNLTRIAAAKSNELETYALERVRDGMALSRAPSVVRAVRTLTAGREDAAGAALPGDTEPFLGYAAGALGYAQLLLIDNDGRVLFALDDSIHCCRARSRRRSWRSASTGRARSCSRTCAASRPTARRRSRWRS